jgi:RNA polymerase sigma-70 factor (ECF subfamily)
MAVAWSAVFCARLPNGATAESPAQALDAQLSACLATAREAWPDLAVDPAQFVSYLAERVPKDEPAVDALASMYVADLYLAHGCLLGVPRALAMFEKNYLLPLASIVGQIDRSPVFVDEVRQLLRDKLFVSSGELPAKIASYSGRGSLQGWVTVAAQRFALSLRRDATRKQRREEALADALPTGADPEIDYLKVRYRAEFREAFGAAIASLNDRQRMLLRLNLVDGLSHERIGAIYHVTKSTATRWIGGAREVILRETRQALARRISVDTAEFNSLVALIGSQLDVSLIRLLTEG